ncbi:MAG: HAMP domain-containing protein [Anaerolineales bacterium]|nr:HAMP domain-containing protein [Anaerolineales bacterium]
MFRSILWRLVGTYVLLTSLTAVLMGGLAYALVRGYVEQQETTFLRTNAEAVAQQASMMFSPVIRLGELEELARTSAYLGDIRVRILDNNLRVLVDSGSPAKAEQFIRIMLPYEDASFEALGDDPFEFIVVPLQPDIHIEVPFAPSAEFEFLRSLPPETRYAFVRRVGDPWGDRIIFDRHEEEEPFDTGPRSNRTLVVPVGDYGTPVGYVELREGPNLGIETLQTTTRAFITAGVGAVVLAGLMGFLMARRLTAPLEQLTEITGQISAGDLAIRAPEFGVDEIGRLSRQFNEMAGKLQASFDSLSAERDALRRFITDASHELRTPITALKNFNELLLGGAKEDRIVNEEFLVESKHQLQRLEWITQNLLNLSRLDAGLTRPRLEAHHVGDLLQAAVAPFLVRAKEKGLTLEIVEPDPDFEIQVDRTLMELTLSNLLDNALKFTSRGGEVEIGAAQYEDGLRLWTYDNGSGIDPEDMPHVFERFYRSEKVEAEGSGLGLAMVKSVVEAHGGRVWVESEVGVGSRFFIELPTGTISDEETARES